MKAVKSIKIVQRAIVGILGTVLLAAPAWGQSQPSSAASISPGADTDVVGWWAFDDFAQRGAYDRATEEQDISVGRLQNGPGVLGDGLKCDGLTSCIIRKAAKTPRLDGPFAIEAWIAPQTYPWNWCPIVAQNRDEAAGYYFGLDADGHVGLHLAVGGQWKKCISKTKLPLMKWSHVVGMFHPKHGITVYVNGMKAGYLPTVGELTPAEDTDLRIARNHKKKPPAHIIRTIYSLPAAYSFDGLLDEIKIHRGTMSDQRVREAFVSTKPLTDPNMKPRRLPSGPKGATHFGAFYERLKYDDAWDALWRGEGPDVVVGFDSNPCRLIFWRGTSYAPCWVSENGKWFSHEFMERSPGKAGLIGCCESMSDKRAQYSHVKILENNDARTIVYWRYSPCDIRYDIPYVDEETGLGDWAEEYHTIYPDGVAVRRIVMHSSNFKDWHEWCQSLPIMQPGEMPEDVLNCEDVLSLANMQGESRSYAWPLKDKKVLPGANIQVIHYKSRYWPFLVLWDRNARIRLWGDQELSEHSSFSWWNHWPVAQVACDGRNAVAADRPAHSCTSTQDCAPYETSENTQTKIMLCGMADKKAGGLVPLARSWLHPPKLQLQSPGYHNHGYDPAERAYILSCDTPGQPPQLKVKLTADKDSPLVNLAILVKSWGHSDAVLTISGKEVPRGKTFRLGHHQHIAGTDDLIVWIQLESDEPIDVSLTTP